MVNQLRKCHARWQAASFQPPLTCLAKLGAVHPTVNRGWHEPRPRKARQQRPPRAVEEAEVDTVLLTAAVPAQHAADDRSKNHPERQGDAADAVFYIKSGRVKVAIVSKEGKEAVVAILGTDEFFGEGILIGQPKRLATASAACPGYHFFAAP
jgi:CRP-like cAMP-binding protein